MAGSVCHIPPCRLPCLSLDGFEYAVLVNAVSIVINGTEIATCFRRVISASAPVLVMVQCHDPHPLTRDIKMHLPLVRAYQDQHRQLETVTRVTTAGVCHLDKRLRCG